MDKKFPYLNFSLYLIASLLLGGIIIVLDSLGFRHVSNLLFLLCIPLLSIILHNSRSVFLFYLGILMAAAIWVTYITDIKNFTSSVNTILIFCSLLLVMREIITNTLNKQKKAEDEIKIREQNYREIFNGTDEMILVLHAVTGEIININNPAINNFGYETEEFIDLSLDQLSDGKEPFTLENALKLIHKAKDDKPQTFEWLCRRKNGETFWVEMVLRYAKLGGKDRILAVARDITARREIEQERNQLIEDLQKALDEITQLQQILPICSHCKKIRTDDGYWEQVDQYLLDHFHTPCSHSICPDCLEKFYDDIR